jgi:hypothetical protein
MGIVTVVAGNDVTEVLLKKGAEVVRKVNGTAKMSRPVGRVP